MSYRLKERSEAWTRRHFGTLLITTLVVLFLIIFFYPYVFFTIESGHAGVIFRRFFGGTVTSHVRDEGFQVIPPWDKLIIYDVRVQQVEHNFHVLSSNGLDISVVVSIRYRPKVELLGVLHKEVGPEYVEKIVIPEVQALVRQVFGQYTPEEIYTTKRSLIEQTLQEALGQIAEKYVSLDDLLLKAIILPPAIEAAIEAKLVEEQRALEMKFRIEREKQEAERKVIEAEGVDVAQQIIGQSLSSMLLSYKGIEATLNLAMSHNAKVVVVGGNNGLPLILNSGFGDQQNNGSQWPAWTNLFGGTNVMGRPANATNLPPYAPPSLNTNTPRTQLSLTNWVPGWLKSNRWTLPRRSFFTNETTKK
jgi:regulator of protease activity HflC (stomatin/prohibitin superfamily)